MVWCPMDFILSGKEGGGGKQNPKLQGHLLIIQKIDTNVGGLTSGGVKIYQTKKNSGKISTPKKTPPPFVLKIPIQKAGGCPPIKRNFNNWGL